jgi:hypothetical protein
MSLTSLNLNSANKLVLEAFDSGWKTYEVQGTKFFNKQAPERVDEKFSITAADGSIPTVAENGNYPSINIAEVGSKTLSQLVYKRAIEVSKLMKRFDNYGVVIREATKLGYRAKYTMDEVMADVFNNATGTSTTWDGYALLYASHKVGDLVGQTQSNIVAGALSKTTFNEAYVKLQKQKDHGGKVMPTTGKWLVYNPTLHMQAFELVGSPNSPENANRNINYVNSLGIDLVSWPLLTSTTGWFLIADKMFNRLQYLVAIEPEINYVRNDSNGSWEYQIDFACKAGAPDYLGVAGSAG